MSSLPAHPAPPPAHSREPEPTDGESNSIEPTVAAAVAGDGHAWSVIHQRFAPLIRSVAARYRLFGADADDVAQIVWLKLFEHLPELREPRALPAWIVTTTRNESVRLLGHAKRAQPADPATDSRFNVTVTPDFVDGLEAAERRQAVRAGLDSLPPRHRELLLLLSADEEMSYVDIARRLGIAVGSIGPIRARCLDRIRTSRPVRRMLAAA